MSHCYELSKVRLSVRSGEHERWHNDGATLEILGDAERMLDEILEPYDSGAWQFSIGLNNATRDLGFLPWGIIAMTRELSLVQHVGPVCKNGSGLWFAPYSKLRSSGVPHAVGFIIIRSKDSLERVTHQISSPIFGEAWNVLSSRSEDRHWLFIADVPDASWMAANEDTGEHFANFRNDGYDPVK